MTWKKRLLYLSFRFRERAKVFQSIHKNNFWADDESVSGWGSTLDFTKKTRDFLSILIKRAGIRSVFDAACGDVNWLKEVDFNGADYLGADIVPEIIARNIELYGPHFVCSDIIIDDIPRVDLIICRDLLMHLSLEEAEFALRNLVISNSQYILVTNFPKTEKNCDVVTGGFRPLNMFLPPFNFPKSLYSFEEISHKGGSVVRTLELYLCEELKRELLV